MQSQIESFSAAETRALGEQCGKEVAAGEVYALTGDLGVGKTVFSQGFAAGLGIRGPVNSPTFTILQIYEGGRLPFYHMDAYRLEDEDEFEAIGGCEYLDGDGVCLIEWSDRIRGLLPRGTVTVEIRKDLSRGTDYRLITLSREEA